MGRREVAAVLVAAFGCLVLGGVGTGFASVPTPDCPAVPAEVPRPSSAPLPIGITVSDDSSANQNLAALRPPSGAPMQIHLYEFYPLDHPIIDQVIAYHDVGYKVLVTLRNGPVYPPPDLFSAWVTQLLAAYGRYMGAVEITNEPNSITFGPSDGPGPNELPDLVAGVIAAKSAVKQYGLRIPVGFNYVFGYHDGEDSFWEQLKALATPQFLASVDFMGLHTYPNFFAADTPVDDSINATEIDALRTGRCYMTYLGLAPSIPIDVDEVGYPTPRGPLEYDAQADYWRRVLDEIYAYRANYNIEGVDAYAWNTPPWGITEIDGTPKPAYYLIKQRQAEYNPKLAAAQSPARSSQPSTRPPPRCEATSKQRHSRRHHRSHEHNQHPRSRKSSRRSRTRPVKHPGHCATRPRKKGRAAPADRRRLSVFLCRRGGC